MPKKKSKRKSSSARKSTSKSSKASKRPFLLSALAGIWNAIKVTCIYSYKGIKWMFSKSQEAHTAVKTSVKKKARKKQQEQLDVLKNYEPMKILEIHEGSHDEFEKKVHKDQSTIGIILGARGKGKSAIGMRILENISHQTSRPCYAIGFLEEKLPSYIQSAQSFDEVKKGSVVLIDEGGVLYNSRDSMSEANKMLSEALLIARHNDLSILFISQNSANLEINTLRQADYLVLKPSSLLQKDFERKKIKDIYDDVAQGMNQYAGDKGLTYIYSNEFRGFVSNTLPSFWNPALSKSFRKE